MAVTEVYDQEREKRRDALTAAGEEMRQHATLLRSMLMQFLEQPISLASVELFTKRLDDLADRIAREGEAQVRRSMMREATS